MSCFRTDSPDNDQVSWWYFDQKGLRQEEDHRYGVNIIILSIGLSLHLTPHSVNIIVLYRRRRKKTRARCASFRIHCGADNGTSSHEIRDALKLNFLLFRLDFKFLRVHKWWAHLSVDKHELNMRNFTPVIQYYFTGPIGMTILPYISFNTCAIAAYMAEKPQTMPS